MRGNSAIDDAQYLAHDGRLAGEQKTQRKRHAEDPLTHGLMRQDFVDQQGGAVGHSSRSAAAAKAAELATERHQMLMAAAVALDAQDMAATIRYITRKPNLEKFGIGGSATLANVTKGTEMSLFDAVVNVPIIEGKLAFRALTYYRADGGYLDNPAIGITDVDDARVSGGRLSVRAAPSDRLTIRRALGSL